MAKHVINEDQADTVTVSESGSEWVINKGVLLSGTTGIQNFDHDFIRFTIAGKIDSTYRGLQSIGTPGGGDTADQTSVVVAATGRIYSHEAAVNLDGSGASVDNSGIIRSATEAVSFEGGDIEIYNDGTISSEQQAIHVYSTSCSIRNDGRIVRTTDGTAVFASVTDEGSLINGRSAVIGGAVDFYGSVGDITLRNKGTIRFDEASTPESVFLGSGDDALINRGRILGEVYLGAGHDEADLRHGKLVNSLVRGEDGDDTFIVDRANTPLSELAGEGNDTIKTSVSYALGDAATDYFETLTAIGGKNINLTGNGRANVLNGNTGDNQLSGGNGDDILTGGRGDDLLSGGDGADDFYFFQKTGDDRIAGFNVNEDAIHLGNIPGIGMIDDLQSHVTTAKNGDVIIDLGEHGSIRLAGIGEDAIDQIEFQIEL